VPGIPRPRIASILQVFRDHGVDFIVVGGIAALLEGVDVTVTPNTEVVPSREPGNIARLLLALDSLDATYRSKPELKPNESHLASPGHKLLATRFGPLDVLGTIGRGRGYDDLLPHTHEVELGDRLRVRVLDLETLIAVKEEVAGEKGSGGAPHHAAYARREAAPWKVIARACRAVPAKRHARSTAPNAIPTRPALGPPP
jgi:hypothetical protein